MTLQDGESLLHVAPGRLVARTPSFHGEIRLEIESDEPNRWAAALQNLAAQGFGAETIRSRSGQLTATFAMAKKDELHVSVVLQDAPDFLHELRLFLSVGQADLPRIIEEFRLLSDENA